jgi:hypothetical protein
MRCAAVIVLTILLACGSALAADQTVPPSPPAAALPAGNAPDDDKLDLQKPEEEVPKAAESWWQKVVRGAPNCKSFTDGCRTCSLTVCSNIGIACQPKEWSCNDGNADASPNNKPEVKPDADPDARK